jgi:hypothetical protein
MLHDAANRGTNMKAKKGYIDRSETFDEFLAKDGLLGETEDTALKEIIADQIKVATESRALDTGPPRPHA